MFYSWLSIEILSKKYFTKFLDPHLIQKQEPSIHIGTQIAIKIETTGPWSTLHPGLYLSYFSQGSQWSETLQFSAEQERPAVADKPARRLRNVCTVYVRAVGL